MERLVKLQLVVVLYVPFRLSNSSPLSFGFNLQQAILSTAFTQSNRSCTRCGAAIPATDFFQGQNNIRDYRQNPPTMEDINTHLLFTVIPNHLYPAFGSFH